MAAKQMRKMIKEKECLGQCPYCGSSDVEWIDSYLSDDYYVYEGECGNCDKEFKEFYTLAYATTEYEE